MAIVFEQPQPMDAEAAYGSGLREAMEKDREFALQAWKAQANQLNEQQKLGQQAYQFEAGRMPSQRDVFTTKADFAKLGMQQDYGREMQQAEQQGRMDLQQAVFTNRDRLDSQRLQNNQSMVRGMVRQGMIRPEDEQAYLQMVTPEINALQILDQRTRQQHMQSQMSVENAQHAAITARTTEATRFTNAQLSTDPPRLWTDSSTGRRFMWTPRNGWEQLQEARQQPQQPTDVYGFPLGGTGHSGGSGSSGSSGGMTGMSPAAALATPREIHQIAADMRRELQDLRGRNALAGATQQEEEPAWANDTAAFEAALDRRHAQERERVDRVNRAAALHVGGPLPFDEDPIEQGERPTAPRLGTFINFAIRSSEHGRRPNEARQWRAIGVALRDGQTTGDLTPEQQAQIGRLGYYHGQFTPQVDRALSQADARTMAGPPAPGQTQVGRPADMANPQRAANVVRARLSQYGSLSSMPPATRERVIRDMRSLGINPEYFLRGPQQEPANLNIAPVAANPGGRAAVAAAVPPPTGGPVARGLQNLFPIQQGWPQGGGQVGPALPSFTPGS